MIPHLGVSFGTVARWLEFRLLGFEHSRISATVEELKAGFRVWLAVTPRGGSPAYLSTRTEADLDDALLDASTAVYGVLRPAVLAAYLFSRADRNRSLLVIRQVLNAETASIDDQAAAYRVWAFILRDQGEYEEARHKLEDAISLWGKNGRRHHPTASTRVDIARIYLIKGRWADAIEACRQATESDSAWAVPHTLWGDALLASGDPRRAIERYRVATEKDRTTSRRSQAGGARSRNSASGHSQSTASKPRATGRSSAMISRRTSMRARGTGCTRWDSSTPPSGRTTWH
jgi:hypothetical protein